MRHNNIQGGLQFLSEFDDLVNIGQYGPASCLSI